MNNMEIYEAARAVPQEAQKQFDNGSFKGTDINPMWRIKKLTELFGPCGVGWYYDIVSERAEEHGDQTMAIVDINLYIKVDGEWSKPIYGTGGNNLKKTTSAGKTKTSDEGYKMALTDALSVAAKALGIGADIYFSADRTKYTTQEETKGPTIVCADCGKTILDAKRRDGSIWPASEIAEYGKARYGRPLCPACGRKEDKAMADAEKYARRENGEE